MSMESPEPKLPSVIVLDESDFLEPDPELLDQEPNPDRYSSDSESDSSAPAPIKVLEEFAKKTFQRYEESNQTIDTFGLILRTDSYSRFGLATEWTLKALKLGATKLVFRFNYPNIGIPLKEVFGNQNVAELYLESSRIIKLKVAECPGLKKLVLRDLTMDIDPFFDIFSCCPSVENLSVKNISRGDSINPKNVESPPPPPTIILPKLTSLVLCGVHSQFQIKTLFLDDFSAKFPNLKDLTLALTQNSFCPELEVIKVSSASLETLNIVDDGYCDRYHQERNHNKVPRVEFDVPSIRKVTFKVIYIPDVSFRSMPGHLWEESHVSITKRVGISTVWFSELSEFLAKLEGSRIYLCLHMHINKSFDYEVGKLDGLNVCEVEDMTLDIKDLPSLSCHALLDGLFRMSRPKTITQYNDDDDRFQYRRSRCVHYVENTRNKDFLICRALEAAMQVKSLLLPTQFMYGLRDLEDVNAEQLIDEVWKPQPLGSILDGSTSKKIRFRLQLKWMQ